MLPNGSYSAPIIFLKMWVRKNLVSFLFQSLLCLVVVAPLGEAVRHWFSGALLTRREVGFALEEVAFDLLASPACVNPKLLTLEILFGVVTAILAQTWVHVSGLAPVQVV